MSDEKFAVLAEKKGYEKALYCYELTFSALMDNIVIPYQANQPFFIDGVPVESSNLQRIKIIRQHDSFASQIDRLAASTHLSKNAGTFIPVQEFPARLDIIFRTWGVDVTSQTIQAYKKGIGDRVGEYLKDPAIRKVLLDGTREFFKEGLKFISS